MAALATVAVGTPVLAQTAGVLSLDDVPHFTIASQVETTYDTNVVRSDAANAARDHLTPADVLTQPSVTIDTLLPVGRESVFLNGLIGYDFYDRNTMLNRERVDLIGGLLLRFSRCQAQVKGNYGRFQTRLEELLPGPGAPPATVQNVATVPSVGLTLSCPRADGLSPTLSVSHSSYSNSSEYYRFTNNSSNSALGGLTYARTGFGAIQVYGNYTAVAYDNPFLVPFPPFQYRNNFDLYTGGVRYDRPIGSRLSGSVSIAYSSLHPALSIVPGFSGLTYSAALHYQLSPRLDLNASTSRSTLPTNEVGAAYTIDSPWQVNANYSLGTRLNLSVGGYDDSRTFQGGSAAEIQGLMTSERIHRIFGSLSMTLNRRLSAVLGVVDEWRTSNLTLYNYTDNRVSLTLKSVF